MPESWSEFPFAVVFVLFLCVITLRGQGTYWIARFVTTAALRAPLTQGTRLYRINRWITRHVEGPGTRGIQRYGLIVIPLAHLTVGFQTLVLAGAGVLRIPWWRFSIAQFIGGLAWSTIYTTVGFTVWWATVRAVAGSWWLALLGGILAVGALVWIAQARDRVPRAETPRPSPSVRSIG